MPNKAMRRRPRGRPLTSFRDETPGTIPEAKPPGIPGEKKVGGGPAPKPVGTAITQTPTGKGKGKKKPKGGKGSLPEPRPPKGTSKPPSLPRHAPTAIVVKRKEGAVGKGDVEAVKRLLLEAAFNAPSSSRSEAPQAPRIREVTLESESVVVKVWDELSRDFALAALGGGPFRAEARHGHLRMVMNVSTTWGGFPPERLMENLAAHNPELPDGALTFVSRTRSSGGGWAVFVDVSRQGLAYLRRRGFELQTLLEAVLLRPAEK